MTVVLGRVFDPWRHSSTWWTLTHLVTDVVVGVVTFSVVITLLATTLGLLVTVVGAMAMFWLLMVVSRGFGHLERSRAAALLGVPLLDPVPPLQCDGLVAAPPRTGQVAGAVEGGRLPACSCSRSGS